MKFAFIVKWFCLIFGSIGCISSGYIYYTHKNKIGVNKDVRQTTSAATETKLSPSIRTVQILNIDDNKDSGLNSKCSSASAGNPKSSP